MELKFNHSLCKLGQLRGIMRNTYCLIQVKFITEYTNVQHVIITQILLKMV